MVHFIDRQQQESFESIHPQHIVFMCVMLQYESMAFDGSYSEAFFTFLLPPAPDAWITWAILISQINYQIQIQKQIQLQILSRCLDNLSNSDQSKFCTNYEIQSINQCKFKTEGFVCSFDFLSVRFTFLLLSWWSVCEGEEVRIVRYHRPLPTIRPPSPNPCTHKA